MTDLFSNPSKHPYQPLAEKLRPKSLNDVVGQDHLVGDEGVLHHYCINKQLNSLILWGPPGTGKTTIARLLAAELGLQFTCLSAVFSGVADLKRIFDQVRHTQSSKPHILFIDEIHRFNKAQQDALLGPVESGLVVLIGATTENPSFSLNNAVLSRAQVLPVKRLDESSLGLILNRIGNPLPLTEEGRRALIAMADGDGRMLINLAETLLLLNPPKPLNAKQLGHVLQRRAAHYDKSDDGHYQLISAFIKSMRGSDPDAALYWMARMLAGGEDPLYIARRSVRFAVEDIGLSDPQALIHAMAAMQAYQQLGSPEGELALANAVVYLATAPKSNRVYDAFGKAMASAEKTGSLPPPKHIVNAPTTLMKDMGYGQGYVYDQGTEAGFSGQNYFPEGMERQQYYHPHERGFEREIKKRLDYWQKLRRKL